MPLIDALVSRAPRPPGDVSKTGCLNNCLVWEHEAVKVVLTKAGPGQAFLVAQVAPWGADAAPAARAAYGEIARVLQDQA